MKIFNSDYLNKLTMQANVEPRKRKNHNIHVSHADPCQRLFNANLFLIVD
jgi:hypothetical protein